MVNNQDKYFMKSVIKALDIDLNKSHHTNQYLNRRIKLGIA